MCSVLAKLRGQPSATQCNLHVRTSSDPGLLLRADPWGSWRLAAPDLASRNRARRVITASQVLCFSCLWMALNLLWMMPTMCSISLEDTGLTLLCSRRRLVTCVVNSRQAWVGKDGPACDEAARCCRAAGSTSDHTCHPHSSHAGQL